MIEVPVAAARRRRLLRLGNRLALFAVTLALVGLGIRAHGLSDDVRRPVGPTLPSALEDDIQRKRGDFNRFIPYIRPIGPRSVPAFEPREPPRTDDQASAPVRMI